MFRAAGMLARQAVPSASAAARIAARRSPAFVPSRSLATSGGSKSSLMGRLTGFIAGFSAAMIGGYVVLVEEIRKSTDVLEAANKKLGQQLKKLEADVAKLK